jgi:peptidoglycan/LPS O-acetylase OafA/YrhL
MVRGRPDWRSDIEGMRAVGALLVAIFHIWIGGVSGGVDAFFVAAGFFMTQSAMREIEKTGGLDVVAVWTRLSIRLLPGLIICLVGVIALTFLFLRRQVWPDAMKHVAASALYVHNWYLIALESDTSPNSSFEHMTQHFWAISLIGQAYLLLPMLLAVIVRIRCKSISRASVLMAVLAGVTTISFVYGLHATLRDADAAYYNLFTRFWQFSAGAMIAAAPGIVRRTTSRWIAMPGSWLGLVLLTTCGIAIGTTASFPGTASLWPVTAVTLIILFGRQDDAVNAGWLLSRRPVRRLGSLAYGIYLWHWPLCIIVLEAVKWESLSLWTGTAIILAAIALAWISEKLGRLMLATRWLRASPRRTSLVLLGCLVVIAAGTAGASYVIGP